MTREEAIKRLKEYAQYSYGIWHDNEEDTKAFDMAIEALQQEEHLAELEAKAVAIIKSERHGEWIDTEFLRIKECSCCHTFRGKIEAEDFDFCPNCGAKMDGGKESEVEE